MMHKESGLTVRMMMLTTNALEYTPDRITVKPQTPAFIRG